MVRIIPIVSNIITYILLAIYAARHIDETKQAYRAIMEWIAANPLPTFGLICAWVFWLWFKMVILNEVLKRCGLVDKDEKLGKAKTRNNTNVDEEDTGPKLTFKNVVMMILTG